MSNSVDRNRTSLLLAISLMALANGAFLGFFGIREVADVPEWAQITLLIVTSIFMLTVLFFAFIRVNRLNEARQLDVLRDSLTERQEELERRERSQEEDLPGESISVQIESSLTREQLQMVRAWTTAERSSLLARLLFVLGLGAPVLATLVYLWADPLDPVARALVEVAATQPALIGDIDPALVRRDWRVLVAGISFGFLFLASAAGLLRDARQRSAVGFRFARRVATIESYLLAFRLQQRLVSTDGGLGGLEVTVESLIDRLIEGDPGYGDAPETEGDDGSVAALRTLLDGLRRGEA